MSISFSSPTPLSRPIYLPCRHFRRRHREKRNPKPSITQLPPLPSHLPGVAPALNYERSCSPVKSVTQSSGNPPPTPLRRSQKPAPPLPQCRIEIDRWPVGCICFVPTGCKSPRRCSSPGSHVPSVTSADRPASLDENLVKTGPDFCRGGRGLPVSPAFSPPLVGQRSCRRPTISRRPAVIWQR